MLALRLYAMACLRSHSSYGAETRPEHSILTLVPYLQGTLIHCWWGGILRGYLAQIFRFSTIRFISHDRGALNILKYFYYHNFPFDYRSFLPPKENELPPSLSKTTAQQLGPSEALWKPASHWLLQQRVPKGIWEMFSSKLARQTHTPFSI